MLENETKAVIETRGVTPPTVCPVTKVFWVTHAQMRIHLKKNFGDISPMDPLVRGAPLAGAFGPIGGAKFTNITKNDRVFAYDSQVRADKFSGEQIRQ